MMSINLRVIQLLGVTISAPAPHCLYIGNKGRPAAVESVNLSRSFTRHHRTRHFTCADPRRSHSPHTEKEPPLHSVMMFHSCSIDTPIKKTPTHDHEEYSTHPVDDDNIVYTMLITARSDRVSAGVLSHISHLLVVEPSDHSLPHSIRYHHRVGATGETTYIDGSNMNFTSSSCVRVWRYVWASGPFHPIGTFKGFRVSLSQG